MILYQTKDKTLSLRSTTIEDSELILSYIHKLAIYEKCEDAMTATKSDIEKSLFIEKQAEVIIIEHHEIPIGFALYFLNYSTFLGKANLYLEDLFIDEVYRHKGYGKHVFKYLAYLALEKGCERMDWMCLTWNDPAKKFYESMGAKPMSDWVTYRLDHERIKGLTKE